MTTSVTTTTNHDIQTVPRQADSDRQLLDLWLHGRAGATRRAYRADAERFLAHVAKNLHMVTLGDLQAFADSLDHHALQASSKHRMVSAIKSLVGFGHRIGYLPFDVAKPLRLPTLKDTLSERILSEVEVQRMFAVERQPRNYALLFLLYAAGVRVSEACALKWRDLQERTEGGQVTVFGKGGKTHAVVIPMSVWKAVTSLRGEASEDAPVFRSRRGGHLNPSQVLRVVKKAARLAGIKKAVSPHWLRHAHGSHALDHGAPIHLVQQTLAHASIATTGRYLHARPSESSARFLPL